MSDQKPTYTVENPKPYNEKEFYDNEIQPLVDKITELCLKKDLPYLISIQTAWTKEHSFFSGSVFSGTESYSAHICHAWEVFD